VGELRAGEVRRPSRRRSEIATRGESRYAYLTLLPVLVIMAAFSLYPIGYSVYLSLHKEVLTDPLNNPFVGFQNFGDVLQSYYLTSSLVSTAAFMAMAVPGVMIFGLLAALLLNEAFAGATIRGERNRLALVAERRLRALEFSPLSARNHSRLHPLAESTGPGQRWIGACSYLARGTVGSHLLVGWSADHSA